ncbi:HIR complex subunit [Chytriomyces hyalinus]|nr:HIR complex subunit [Chytriomyces hyalinus]
MLIVKPSFVQHPGDKGRKLPIYACHVQPGESKRIATGGQDCKVRIWNTAPILDDSSADCDKLLATLSNHTGAVLSVRWSQTGTLLATGADDSTIVVWCADTSRPADQRRDNLIQGGAGNIESWRAIKVLFGHDSDVADLAWSPSNEYLASCGLDSLVFIWDGKTFDKLKKLEAHQGFVKGITWDPVGKYLATQSDDKTVKIWRTSDWVVEREITEPFTQASSTTFFRRLSWSPDGSCIAMANGENGNVPVCPIVNRDTWISDVSLVGHQAPIEVAAFNPVTFEIEIPDEDGEEGATKRVVSSVCAIAGQDRSVSIWWTARPFSAASALDVFHHTVLDLSWSSDGYTLYACSYDGTVSAFTFSSVEFGIPVSTEQTELALSKYGFQKVKQAVAESTTQLFLEEQYRNLQSNIGGLAGAPMGGYSSAQPSAGTPSIAEQVNVIQMGKQRESRTKDGKRRITPVLIRSARSPQQHATITIGAKPLAPQSNGLNNGKGIPTVDISTAAGKRKAPDSSETDQPTNGSVYVLPAYTAVSSPSRLLAMPAVKPKTLTIVKTGPTQLNLECVNADASKQAGATITGSRAGISQFITTFNAPVILVAGGDDYWVAACLDATLNVFSAAGRRMLPPFVLPSPASFLSVNGAYLMAILTTSTVFLWDISKETNLLSNEPVTPLLTNASNNTPNCLTLSNAFVRADGKPMISTSNGDVFIYHYGMKCWMNVRGFDSDQRVSSAVVTGEMVNPAGFKIPAVGVLGKIPALIDHAELGMACSTVLELASDYKQWLILYARKLSDDGEVAKAKELCDELLGELSASGENSSILGMQKRGLLKEILPILATNRDLQRIVASYHEYLSS